MQEPRTYGSWPLFGREEAGADGTPVAEAGSEADVARRLGELAFLIRAERRLRDWSAEQLARKAGISRSTLSQLENGARYPSAEHLLRLMSVLELSSTPPGFEEYFRQPGLRSYGEEHS